MLRWTEAFQAKLDELIQKHENGTLEGVYDDVPIEVYHHPLCPGFSKTDLDIVSRSMDHLSAYKAERIRQYQDPTAEEKRNLIVGAAFHDALFTPERFEIYKVEPTPPEVPAEINRRTKIGKEEFLKWNRDVLVPWTNEVLIPFQKEKIGVTEVELEMIHKMRKRAEAHELFQSIIAPARKEVTIFYRDARTGILLKVRPDALNLDDKICLDAKSTVDAAAVAFRKTIANYNYDKQAAMQMEKMETFEADKEARQ